MIKIIKTGNERWRPRDRDGNRLRDRQTEMDKDLEADRETD